MQFNGRFTMESPNTLIAERHLRPGDKVQKYIDSECIRRMKPYTPFLSGVLEKSVTIGTRIGYGNIKQSVPYAKYQYYGKLMVSRLTGSSYASKGESKVLTNKDLVHNTSRHSKAGSYWFERMKNDHKTKILKGAQKIADGK